MVWLANRMQESYEKFRTRIIFIDHLHFLFDMARTRSPSIEIGTVIRQLKAIAVQKEFIIFLLCHTKKITRDDKIDYSIIRDSSFVAQESDCVLLIVRDIMNPDSGEAKLKVEFHRRTGVLNKVIELVKIDGYLREKDKTCIS